MQLQASTIKSSFETVRPRGQEFVENFFSNLWSDFPGSKTLFKAADAEGQKQWLYRSFVLVVDNIEDGGRVTTYLRGLGLRHPHAGASDEVFIWFSRALIKTLRDFLGAAWNDPLESQWQIFLTSVASAVRQGSSLVNQNHSVEPPRPEGASARSDDLSRIHATIALPDAVKHRVRTKVRSAIKQLINDELRAACQEELDQLESFDLKSLVVQPKLEPT